MGSFGVFGMYGPGMPTDKHKLFPAPGFSLRQDALYHTDWQCGKLCPDFSRFALHHVSYPKTLSSSLLTSFLPLQVLHMYFGAPWLVTKGDLDRPEVIHNTLL